MDEIFSALSHPKRRAILLELFYEGESTVTHFKQDFKMKTGTLYHHLNILKKYDLIDQNDQKSYKLTSKGITFVEPLFADNSSEFNALKENFLNVDNELKTNERIVSHDKYKRTTINTYSDKVMSFLFNHSKIILSLNLFLILLMILSLGIIQQGLLGHYLFSTEHIEISISSTLLTILVSLALLALYPRIMNKVEPVNIEFFMVGLLLFIPTFVFTSLIHFFFFINQKQLITQQLLLLMEFFSQIFWLIWIYVVFRKINGLDYLRSLLGSFIINYIWLTIIFFIIK